MTPASSTSDPSGGSLPYRWSRFSNRLPAALITGAVAGTLAGVAMGWHFAAAGFPFLVLDSIRKAIVGTTLGLLAFLLLFEICRAALQRLPDRLAVPLAAGLAGAPFVALAGLQLNRAWGVRPSEILTSYALVRNSGLLALSFALYLVACVLLRRWHPSPSRSHWLLALATIAATLALHAGVVAGFGQSVKDNDRPDVIVLLIDALRADHLSSYGYPRETTPTLDAVAREGVLFHDAIASSTFTKSSIASLLTGRHPYQHGVYWGSLRLSSGAVISDLLDQDETLLAEELRKRGYLTTGWVQNSHLRGALGFGQGSVLYRDSQGSIERIQGKFKSWLRGPGRRYGYFTYLHYIDLHDPYHPKPPYDTRFGDPGDVYAGIDLDQWGAYLADVRNGDVTPSADQVQGFKDLYDGQLRYIDDQIGLLLKELRELGLYDDSLIVITSDHGDGFMEHGFISHSTTPYEELVRVPLIVKFPGGRFAGRVVERQVRLIDVLPTVLDAVGARAAKEVAGCSLLPLVEDPEAVYDPRLRCDLAVTEIAEEGAYPIVAVRRDGWKYIHHENRPDELYNLELDPGEQNNLLPIEGMAAPEEINTEGTAAEGMAAEGMTDGEIAEELAALALEVVAARPAVGDRVELDEQAKRELRALGYLE